MDFWQHLKALNEIDLQGITEGLAARFSELISRGHSIADLISHYGDDFGHLPPERLRSLVQSHRTWQLWRRLSSQINETRRQAASPEIPAEILACAPRPDQLDALVRILRFHPAPNGVDFDTWKNILQAGTELWTRCLALVRKNGKIRSRAKNLNHPEAASFDPYVRLEVGIEDLPAHRWLAMRRGEKEKILEIDIELPQELLLNELPLFQYQLGHHAQSRTPESLLEELVLNDLKPWLLRLLDSEAQNQAVAAAAESLAGLLRTSPLQVRLLGSLFVMKSRAPLAVVIVDREGDLVAHRMIKPDGNWADKVVELFQEHELQYVVLPTTIVGADLLTILETKLSSTEIQIIKMRTAAIAEARQVLVDPPHRLSPSIASAMILARRALDPLKEWSLVDPVNIGIAEYQNDLDPEQLRTVLLETAELCRLERRRGKRLYISGGASPRGSTAMARLNPLVKSLADLRPGMSVHGLVTNISHFGAFVNIGLPQEALVHISELCDHFISNPNEVVSIGQQVTAHVLSVDPGRGRISLSLKTRRNPTLATAGREERIPRAESFGRSAPKPTAGSMKANSPMSKAQALANLEKLFKK